MQSLQRFIGQRPARKQAAQIAARTGRGGLDLGHRRRLGEIHGQRGRILQRGGEMQVAELAPRRWIAEEADDHRLICSVRRGQ